MPRPTVKTKKNKKRRITLLLIAGFILAGLATWYLIITVKEENERRRAEAAFYDAFGIDMPGNYTIHGIDVSSHQKLIHWPSVKSMTVNNTQLNFVFIKATEGLNDVDKQFKTNWLNARTIGMTCGAYHFFLATKSGAKQAANFISAVPLAPGDLPPVLDIEELYGVPPAMMRKRVKECLDSLESYYKIRPILYSYVDFYEKYLGKDFDTYPLWVAHYLEPQKPRIKREWVFWQHSDAGRVNGITTPVDFNVFKGDSLQFRALLIK